MKKIKIYKDGKLIVIEKGTRVRMTRDIILTGEDADYLSLFAAQGEEGTINALSPTVSIKFDLDKYGMSRTFFIPESLSLIDVFELIEEPYLRLVK